MKTPQNGMSNQTDVKIFASIYYIILPMLSTFLAEKTSDAQKSKIA